MLVMLSPRSDSSLLPPRADVSPPLRRMYVTEEESKRSHEAYVSQADLAYGGWDRRWRHRTLGLRTRRHSRQPRRSSFWRNDIGMPVMMTPNGPVLGGAGGGGGTFVEPPPRVQSVGRLPSVSKACWVTQQGDMDRADWDQRRALFQSTIDEWWADTGLTLEWTEECTPPDSAGAFAEELRILLDDREADRSVHGCDLIASGVTWAAHPNEHELFRTCAWNMSLDVDISAKSVVLHTAGHTLGVVHHHFGRDDECPLDAPNQHSWTPYLAEVDPESVLVAGMSRDSEIDTESVCSVPEDWNDAELTAGDRLSIQMIYPATTTRTLRNASSGITYEGNWVFPTEPSSISITAGWVGGPISNGLGRRAGRSKSRAALPRLEVQASRGDTQCNPGISSSSSIPSRIPSDKSIPQRLPSNQTAANTRRSSPAYFESRHPMALSHETHPTETSPLDRTASEQLRLGLAWVFPEPRLVALKNKTLLLGRSQDCDVCLPGQQVSRKHAELTRARTGWVLRDRGSKNGIKLNGRRVDEAPLSPQDVIRVGEWLGVITELTDEQLESGQVVTQPTDDMLAGARILQAYKTLSRAAPSHLSVMLVGETGCGKEVFARELHRLSARAGNFIATNCATIPEQTAEGELFGYRRGAFTGADRASPGHFRSAHGGTLFLDEVADLNPAVQVKLLRALEEKAVVPLGQSQPEPADARLVCAAQEPLHQYVERGRFRSDLYSRLNGVEISIPPLRSRREEVLFHFLRAFPLRDEQRLSPDFVEQLCIYDWPLNVREVIQTASRAEALHHDAPRLTLDHLPRHVVEYSCGKQSQKVDASPGSSSASEMPNCDGSPRDRLAQRLAEALKQAGGNVSLAAKSLGVSRPMAYRLMKRLPDLDPEEIRVNSFDN